MCDIELKVELLGNFKNVCECLFFIGWGEEIFWPYGRPHVQKLHHFFSIIHGPSQKADYGPLEKMDLIPKFTVWVKHLSLQIRGC